MMQPDIYDLVKEILRSVTFIAIGGALAIMFFLIFAQSILGLKSIHAQLEKLLHEAERMSEQLRQIAKHLEKAKGDQPNKE
jgi:hypothetical protein